jgi:hypothetical protein
MTVGDIFAGGDAGLCAPLKVFCQHMLNFISSSVVELTLDKSNSQNVRHLHYQVLASPKGLQRVVRQDFVLEVLYFYPSSVHEAQSFVEESRCCRCSVLLPYSPISFAVSSAWVVAEAKYSAESRAQEAHWELMFDLILYLVKDPGMSSLSSIPSYSASVIPFRPGQPHFLFRCWH